MRPWLPPALALCLLAPAQALHAQPADPFPPPSPSFSSGTWSVDADYALWWLRRAHAPPILTTSSPASPPCPTGPWSVDPDYAPWCRRRAHAPPILTTSSPASQGLLDRPDTRVVYGDEGLETRHHDQFVGGRFAVGWAAPDDSFGL